MLKGKLAVVCLLVVASLIVVNSTANAGIIDPCRSYWQLHATVVPCPLFSCPQGDAPTFLDFGKLPTDVAGIDGNMDSGEGFFLRPWREVSRAVPIPIR